MHAGSRSVQRTCGLQLRDIQWHGSENRALLATISLTLEHLLFSDMMQFLAIYSGTE